MASLAYFIKTCQQEEKYGHDYVNKMDERLQTLNYAQLQGMQDVLEQCIADGKSVPWVRANQKLLEKVNVHIVPRREETLLNEQKKEKTKREAYVKRINKNAKEAEKQRVMQQIFSNAGKQAVIDVKENEFKRQANEKAKLMEIIPKKEEKRNKYARYTFLYFIIMIVLISVALADPLFIACGIVFVFISTVIIAYKVYKIGVITQVVVTDDELEQQRVVRREELIQKSLNSLKKTEIEFNNRLAKEKEERHAYRRKKRADAAKALQEAANSRKEIIKSMKQNESGQDASVDVIETIVNPESDASYSDVELKEDSDIEVLSLDRSVDDNGAALAIAEPKHSDGVMVSTTPATGHNVDKSAAISLGKGSDKNNHFEGMSRQISNKKNKEIPGSSKTPTSGTISGDLMMKASSAVEELTTERQEEVVQPSSWDVNEMV